MFSKTISIKSTENDDDRGRHFELSYMFSHCRKSGCIRMWAILNH